MRWRFFKFWNHSNTLDQDNEKQKLELLEDLRKAHADWLVLQSIFDYAVEPNQIDQVIYQLNAAEKKYELLYRRAKVVFRSNDGVQLKSPLLQKQEMQRGGDFQ